MKLTIKNFAKIEYAEFSINGLTVIAGNNNTGKSTVGKILSSVFNSMIDIEDSLKQARYRNINRELRNFVFHNSDTDVPRLFRSRSLIDFIARFSHDLVWNDEKDLEKVIKNFVESINKLNKNADFSLSEDDIPEIFNIIDGVLKISDDTLMKSVVSMYFQNVFNEQINDVNASQNIASVLMNVKGKKVLVDFKEDYVSKIASEIVFTNSATYIDNPFILDKLNDGQISYLDYSSEHSLVQELLNKLKIRNFDFEYGDQALNQQIVSDKLKIVFDKMIDVVPGELIYDNGYKYKNGKKQKTLDANSLSTGLKSFVLLKQLLLNSSLKEKDVLVLDEPEIHLHPEWQLKYAEIIVLLQKAFNLNVVITTHSSHFLEALDLFSKIHDSKDVCNYYLAKTNENNRSVFIDATNNISEIYSNLVSPSLAIDSIKAKFGLSDE